MSVIKNLFFVNDEENSKKENPKVSNEIETKELPSSLPSSLPTSFPTSEPTSLPSSLPTTIVGADTSKIMEISNAVRGAYESGLESLNKPGYDFYEYYKSIISIKGNSPESYMMAFTLGKSMLPTLTPESLVNDGQFYLDELENAFKKNDEKGKGNLVRIDSQKNLEKESLINSINTIREQITALQQQLDEQTNTYNSIDAKYSEEIGDTNLKIQINTQIKDEFVSNITTVITNIKNYIK